MTRLSRIFSVLVFVSFFAAQAALAFPFPKRGVIPPQRAKVLGYNFEAIFKLNNCSGSLIRFVQSLETDRAVVLTNGHCLEGGMPLPGTFVYNEPSQRGFEILDPRTARTIGDLRATRVIYATMTKTDIGLYQLDETYQEIESKFGIRPLVLAKVIAPVGEEIQILSGYHRKGYECQIEAIVPTLKEGGYTMEMSMRYSRPGCEIIGGTSGSPVIVAGSRSVIGVNNTANENGLECEMNNPCEIDERGEVTAKKGYSYAQQTVQIYSCLDRDLKFDLDLENCRLPGGDRGPRKVRRIK